MARHILANPLTSQKRRVWKSIRRDRPRLERSSWEINATGITNIRRLIWKRWYYFLFNAQFIYSGYEKYCHAIVFVTLYVLHFVRFNGTFILLCEFVLLWEWNLVLYIKTFHWKIGVCGNISCRQRYVPLKFLLLRRTLHFYAFHCIRKSTNLRKYSQRQRV